ncbi:ATP-dependent RNA helicase SUPV3L1/SUV3 [Butyrivibrio sp. ob235]|uniref:helicase-related protein n=1 Tax=Butyrivibrio sp. ob235 TaxID=1761780 RepID=UPI0008CDDEE0|nr:helicase-related protein [Butyrivibrio sp. ob235]SEL01435.1 ATP-dependent RNA helicase SUPV3L1/SUV3 [Butyrivibrio sp. ob235]
MASKKYQNRFARKKAKFKNEIRNADAAFPRQEFDAYWDKHIAEIGRDVLLFCRSALRTERFHVDGKTAYGKVQKQELYRGNIEKFCKQLSGKMHPSLLTEFFPGIPHAIYEHLLEAQDPAIVTFVSKTREKAASRLIIKYLRKTRKIWDLVTYLQDNLMEEDVLTDLGKNPRYKYLTKKLMQAIQAQKLLYENIQTSTPDDLTTLFPLARQMKRKFIIHIGPTNSGKTHQAMEELKKAGSGIYLAPLRLLAYEQYERMNKDGVPCSMITGEERILMPGSYHQASTIEMLDIKEEWDMAVIDEAQMVADEQRGGSWTTAILGVRSKLIHLCASPDAEDTLIQMIESCGDTYEITYHERMTPLVMDENAVDFSFPEAVQNGDALIVFSRRDVHSVAAELQDNDIKCSIIYGALPYDVRHREAEKFASGETGVVVATDAIGMGMNLPIRRVVFLQTVKYDGKDERPLNSSEVKQIAGRAGRYGIYDTGYVTSYYDYEIIKKLLFKKTVPIDRAMVSIPEEFLLKDGKVSTILELWNQIPANDFYDKGDISEKIKIAKALEQIADDRELIRKFIRIPASPDNKDTFPVYLEYYKELSEGKMPDLRKTIKAYRADNVDEDDKEALQVLEISSAIYDFLYSFTRIFGEEEALSVILSGKRKISEKIFTILDKQNLSLRTCIYCGKKLKWSFKFNMCQECYRKRQLLRRH